MTWLMNARHSTSLDRNHVTYCCLGSCYFCRSIQMAKRKRGKKLMLFSDSKLPTRMAFPSSRL
ncbi:hypothetical protein LINPERHAP1_LOCUS20445 [Linum perenne]